MNFFKKGLNKFKHFIFFYKLLKYLVKLKYAFHLNSVIEYKYDNDNRGVMNKCSI